VDEAGGNIDMTRDYARAPCGERAPGFVPRNRGTVTTMLGALDIRSGRALMTVEGGTDADVFEAFLQHVLVPKLRPGDIVILDNVGAHKPQTMRSLIKGAGASLIFLPPCSPDMNPIELCWSKLKADLKDFGARTVEDLHQAIRRAMVVSDIPEHREFLVESGALFFPLGSSGALAEELIQATTDPDATARRRLRAREDGRRLAIDRAVSRYEDVYALLLPVRG